MRKFFGILSLSWITVVLCSTFVTPGEALKCHICNSLYDDYCDEIKDERFLIDCNKVDRDDMKNHTNCRKEVFSAYSKKFEMATERIIRSCGYEIHPRRSCYYASNVDLKGSTCECFEDGCNGSNMLHLASKSLLTVILCAFLASLLVT